MPLIIGAGVTGGLDTTLPAEMLVAAFTAIAWCNSIELLVRIWMTFKRRRGLYFWSLEVATWGVLVYSMFFLFKFFQVVTNDLLTSAIIAVGWWCMVTGQSLVLYSRLYLIVQDAQKIKWILYMIIANAIIFHISSSAVALGVSMMLNVFLGF